MADCLVDLLRSLRFGEMSQREHTIATRAERAAEDSFDWILDTDNIHHTGADAVRMVASFRDWIEGDDSFFWICGKAASGKSTLMRKIRHDSRLLQRLVRGEQKSKTIVASMFFTYEGTELQRSRCGLLRSLLSQALAQDEDLVEPVLGPFLRESKEHHPIELMRKIWGWEELKTAFTLLLSQANAKRRFVFFIDGLDEYSILAADSQGSEDHHVSIADEQGRRIRAGWRDLATMLRSYSAYKFVKMCVSSRPMNEFETAFRGFPCLQLELLTSGDIGDYVRREVGEVVPPDCIQAYEHYIGEIITKASGVFMWVRLATDILVDGIVNESEHSHLEALMNSLPSELGGPNGLYMRMLTSVDRRLGESSRKIFDLVLHARHDLTSLALWFALNHTPEEAASAEIKKIDESEVSSLSELQRTRVKSSCGGLLELQENPRLVEEDEFDFGGSDAHITRRPVLRFIHLTAKEFIRRPDVQEVFPITEHKKEFDPDTALLTACVMRLKRIGVTSSWLDVWSAIKDALYYAKKAEDAMNRAQLRLLDSLDDTVGELRARGESSKSQEYHVPTWHTPENLPSDHHWALCEPQEREGRLFECQDNFASLAVQASLTLYLELKFSDGLSVEHKRGRPLLAYAIIPWSSHNRIEFIRQVQVSDHIGSTHSHLSTVRLLLQNGADPNVQYHPEQLSYVEELGSDSLKQSIWQHAMAWAMDFCRYLSLGNPRWKTWKDTMVLLARSGADVKARVSWKEFSEDQIDEIHEASALLVAVSVSQTHLEGDYELPALLADEGANLLPGEEQHLIETYGMSRDYLLGSILNHRGLEEADCFESDLRFPRVVLSRQDFEGPWRRP